MSTLKKMAMKTTLLWATKDGSATKPARAPVQNIPNLWRTMTTWLTFTLSPSSKNASPMLFTVLCISTITRPTSFVLSGSRRKNMPLIRLMTSVLFVQFNQKFLLACPDIGKYLTTRENKILYHAVDLTTPNASTPMSETTDSDATVLPNPKALPSKSVQVTPAPSHGSRGQYWFLYYWTQISVYI